MLKILPHLLGKKTREYEEQLARSVQEARPYVAPLGLVLTVTTRCNTSCCYCPFQLGSVGMDQKDIPLKDTLGLLDALREQGAVFARFTGGEPLLHGDLPAMVEHACDLRYHVTVVTNGRLLSSEKLPWLKRLSALVMSIDSLDDETARTVRGIARDEYLACLDVVAQLRRKAPRIWIGVNCVVSRHNVASIPALVQELSRHRISTQFQPCHSFGQEENAENYADPATVENLVATLEELRSQGCLINSSPHYLRHMVKFVQDPSFTPAECSAGYFQAIVDPDLALRFCCKLPPLGTLSEESFESLWNGPGARRQREQIRDGQCPRCWLMYMDMGNG